MASKLSTSLLLGFSLIASAASFQISSPSLPQASRLSTTAQFANANDNEENQQLERRDFLDITTNAATVTSLASILGTTPTAALADDEENTTTTTPKSICVIGANGKTGSECIGACLDRSIPVIATSRSGTYTGAYNTENPLLSTRVCDVTDATTIPAAIDGAKAVIFAASASKNGGTASAVDNVGLVNIAKACIDSSDFKHLVIVSSGGVSKPDSSIYKFLNLFGKIMEEKIKGEDTVRSLAKASGSGFTYTVIRPGGLTIEEGMGVSALELNQGDTKSGRIARADVAALCIEAVNYPQLTGGTTFECYNADTAKSLGTVGVSNMMKQKNKADDAVFVSGKERNGDTWQKIFTGLEQD